VAYSTYSFNDINFSILPPTSAGSILQLGNLGILGNLAASVFGSAFNMNGQGVGEINIAYSDDNSTHQRGADGSVMVSKITADNGTISITTQQTSALNTYLIKLFKALKFGPTSIWAGMTITVDTTRGTAEKITCTGVSFAKRADRPYQAEGQMITWNFMAANISYGI
jgi:hypothetical protein